jgi:DUF971 family protein
VWLSLRWGVGQGNYGVSVVWSDGHFAPIYTYDALERIAKRIEREDAERAAQASSR